jgi:hypothetical protein
MTRRSLKLTEANWTALEQLARARGCWYHGQPSWRALIRRIAQGDVTVRSSNKKPLGAVESMNRPGSNHVNLGTPIGVGEVINKW